LHRLAEQIKAKGVATRIVGALSNVRDILRKQGVEEITGPINRVDFINDVVEEFNSSPLSMVNQKN